LPTQTMENPGTDKTKTTGFIKSSANSGRKPDRHLVQVFESEPTDAQLAQFVDPAGKSSSFRVTETSESITAKPSTLPRWFVILSLAIFFGLVIRGLWNEETRPETTREWVTRIVGSITLGVLFLVSVHFLNRKEKLKGDYFTFDKIERTLNLPQYSTKLTPEEIHSFFQLCGKHRSSGTWAFELTVLAKVEESRLARYSVVIDPSRKKVEKIAKQLSESLSVPLRTVKLDRRTRQALRTSSNVNTQ